MFAWRFILQPIISYILDKSLTCHDFASLLTQSLSSVLIFAGPVKIWIYQKNRQGETRVNVFQKKLEP